MKTTRKSSNKSHDVHKEAQSDRRVGVCVCGGGAPKDGTEKLTKGQTTGL